MDRFVNIKVLENDKKNHSQSRFKANFQVKFHF